jgi:hypothetical protein
MNEDDGYFYGLPSEEFLKLGPVARWKQIWRHDPPFFALMVISILIAGSLLSGWLR